MSNKPTSTFNFNHLSLTDLIEARDMFHAHLINKKNVVATAIGRYLIRNENLDDNGKFKTVEKKGKRTLNNSLVVDISWPCILVFVEEWQDEEELIKDDASDIVPKTIYMPDGRIVPICVVLAPKDEISSVNVDASRLRFPDNMIGGGFPVIVNSQQQEFIASIGCVVSNGHTYYALTNKHVSGNKGQVVESRFGFERRRIGVSSGVSLGKVKFSKLYPEWKDNHLLVSCDAGLIEIDDLNIWKTDIVDINHFDEMYDINTLNLDLNLIAEHSIQNGKLQNSVTGNLVAHGGVSGPVKGEIKAFFYRYQSIGGVEYVSDFLIGGRNGSKLKVAHGDSGTVWLLETKKNNKKKLQPIALHWGQHEFFEGKSKFSYTYSLATCLSNVCKELDVQIVRGWNIDNDYSWGKTGHYKIAALACQLVTTPKLKRLLLANLDNISYSDDSMKNDEMKNAKWGEFVPMADVPDIIWRMNRKDDEANHFADMDEKNDHVFNGKDLLEICQDPGNISIDIWNQYYEEMEAIDSARSADKRGALPFRVWQAYGLMVKVLKEDKDLGKFIFTGGTVSHYLGDACQPLHVSYLHHGHPDIPSESPVHSTYETTMMDKNREELFNTVNDFFLNNPPGFEVYEGAKTAAQKVIELMGDVVTNILTPEKIIDVFNEPSKSRIKNMWDQLKEPTIQCIIKGSVNLALFWESAWAEAKGNDLFTDAELIAIEPQTLINLYMDKTNFPSYKLRDPLYKEVVQ